MANVSLASMYRDKSAGSNIKITQVTGAPAAAALAGVDQLLLVLPEKVPSSVWRSIPQGSKIQALMRRRTAGEVPAVRTRISNRKQTTLLVGNVAADAEAFEQLSFGRRLVSSALCEKGGHLGIWVLGFSRERAATLAGRLATAALAAGFTLAEFKSKERPPRIRSIRLFGLDERLDLRRVEAEAQGNNLARWLTALPPNKLDATAYVDFLRELAGDQGWQYKKYGVRELDSMGAGAFLAVARGNPDDSAAIVRLQYRPKQSPEGKAALAPLSLVGKGIIFDTGGTNLKPFLSMADMHIDMGGSAVAVGALLTLTELGFPHAVDCWMPITENRIGPTAYKSQDVITAVNGKTIQIVHTDAEGRLALADALILACRENPRLVIDYATLTGACINAVTRRYSGVFTNRPDWHPILKKAGRDSGERVWPFPLGKEFLAELESDVADIKQCTPDAGGDHILAATFLNEFVSNDIPWIHVDLSAAKRKGGLGAIPTDVTGFGVRLTLDLLLDKQLPDRA